jgi:hypothetical protein
MKKSKDLLMITAVTCLALLVLSCNRQKAPRMVTQPFKAEATGEYKYVGPDTFPDAKCTGTLSVWRAIVDARGTATPLGDFTVHFDFCGDSLSNYGNTDAYILDKDGDSLFLDAMGRVYDGRLDEHPAFVTSYWRDTFRFVGGSGKFKGATGLVIGDDYNSSEDPYSHHRWEGTITMAEEKK